MRGAFSDPVSEIFSRLRLSCDGFFDVPDFFPEYSEKKAGGGKISAPVGEDRRPFSPFAVYVEGQENAPILRLSVLQSGREDPETAEGANHFGQVPEMRDVF